MTEMTNEITLTLCGSLLDPDYVNLKNPASVSGAADH